MRLGPTLPVLPLHAARAMTRVAKAMAAKRVFCIVYCPVTVVVVTVTGTVVECWLESERVMVALPTPIGVTVKLVPLEGLTVTTFVFEETALKVPL